MREVNSNLIEVIKATKSKLPHIDFESLSFGNVFTDHMFICDFHDDTWQTPRVVPYGPLSFDPSARVFHYGQAVFEGMKAYKDEEGSVFLFRPEDNFIRLNKSAERLAIPEIPKDIFFEGLETLLNLDQNWIQSGVGNSLYIRPFIIATQPSVSASEANQYSFMIICSPAQAYYSGSVSVLIEDRFSRSADGGFGYAKAAGNYAGQFYPTKLAKEKGYQQVIWTDASTHEYIEEAGTMNVFFRINDTLITAPVSDRILDGITRKSLISLAESKGISVEIRPVKVQEVVEAAKDGSLKEIFGAGTAAVISPISAFGYKGNHYTLEPIENAYATHLKEALMDIQYNKSDEQKDWRYKVC